MAAYATLVSLMHIVEQIQHNPRPPISLDNQLVESLTRNLAFLQHFLEAYEAADCLESRIADAAYAAEDVIESYILDQTTYHGRSISSDEFYQSLHKVIQEIDIIKTEVMKVNEDKMIQDQLHSDCSIRLSFTGQDNIMVGSDDLLHQVMDNLIGQQCSLQIISVVGMGGIGKTTLARNIYANSCTKQYFDVLAWVTISQVYSRRDIILQALCQKDVSKKSDDELGEILYKDLCGRRYLVVLDDIWNSEAWDEVKYFFPENRNGSRIMVTTRLSALALQLSGSNSYHVSFLDEDKSWDLLCHIVFGKEDCPIELEEIGKKIVKNSRGLPLSIVVIGGLLTRSKETRYWEHLLENLKSVENLEINDHCLQVLHTSYKELPIYLKPCFLYMGVFPEDSEIRVSELIKLWVAEGFLKPIDGKSLEEVADEYLKKLIDRNLVFVHKLGSSGDIKFCKVHDLLRELSIREARKQKFLCITRSLVPNIAQGISTERRIGIHESEYHSEVCHELQSTSRTRSLIVNFGKYSCRGLLKLADHRLLRVFKCSHEEGNMYPGYNPGDIYRLWNIRYFSAPCGWYAKSFEFCHLWNLQTFIARSSIGQFTVIWMMPLLRHVEFEYLTLPDSSSGENVFVLENLQTLLTVNIMDCYEEVIERIPNIKKLKVFGNYDEGSIHCFNALGRLQKLECLKCQLVNKAIQLRNFNFPHSLKKLTLEGGYLPWEVMTTKIGLLPLLEVLKLKSDSFKGPKWVTVDGQFCSLKFLQIDQCKRLQYWFTESAHFPRLEHLRLKNLCELKVIPQGIGEIPTLQSIELKYCSRSVVKSAKKILEEQEELGNEGLRVRARVYGNETQLQSLATHNFHVEIL